MATDSRYANDPPRQHPRVQGRCPACGAESLFLGTNGYVTCSVIGCKDPGAAHDLLALAADAFERQRRIEAAVDAALVDAGLQSTHPTIATLKNAIALALYTRLPAMGVSR